MKDRDKMVKKTACRQSVNGGDSRPPERRKEGSKFQENLKLASIVAKERHLGTGQEKGGGS